MFGRDNLRMAVEAVGCASGLAEGVVVRRMGLSVEVGFRQDQIADFR